MMAKIVAAYAVPHTPSFVADVRKAGPSHEAARLFAAIKSKFDVARPDVVVAIQNDHFNSFFLDNWPMFAIGVASSAAGPSDQTPEMPEYEVAIEEPLATSMLCSLVEAGFDFSMSQHLSLDHSVLVPLHFLTPEMNYPIVPVYINCLVPPLPTARRCYAMGQRLRAAIEAWPSVKRVALLASGSLSLEVGGPRMQPGKTYGVPDRDWASHVVRRIDRCEHSKLIAEVVPSRIAEAGNVAGEILNWIALLGAVGQVKPDVLLEQLDLGNAFAAWNLSEPTDEPIRRS